MKILYQRADNNTRLLKRTPQNYTEWTVSIFIYIVSSVEYPCRNRSSITVTRTYEGPLDKNVC